MTETKHEADGGIIIGALQVTRERVTGTSITGKQSRRDALKAAIDAMYYYLETGRNSRPPGSCASCSATRTTGRSARRCSTGTDAGTIQA